MKDSTRLAALALRAWLAAVYAGMFAMHAWGAAETPRAATVFYNARVFTAEYDHPYADAVAIRGERIVAVGERSSVERVVGEEARRVDLHGKFLMPGMIDAHAHPIYGGMTLVQTRNSARVLDQLDSIGTLAPGKLADLVLVDRDVLTVPPEALKDATVIWTMVAGKIVYGTGP